jgi:hypothetical protein
MAAVSRVEVQQDALGAGRVRKEFNGLVAQNRSRWKFKSSADYSKKSLKF